MSFPVTMRVLVLVFVGLALAPPVLAAAGGGEDGGSHFPFWELFNFAILLAVLAYFGRTPLRDLFSNRRATIAADIEAASALFEQAEARNAKWEQKLAELDREAEELRHDARRRAEHEQERILAEAHEAADRIQRDAVSSVEQELRRAQETLREEAASLATELAAGLLRDQIGDADRERLVDEFISQVGAGSASDAPG